MSGIQLSVHQAESRVPANSGFTRKMRATITSEERRCVSNMSDVGRMEQSLIAANQSLTHGVYPPTLRTVQFPCFSWS